MVSDVSSLVKVGKRSLRKLPEDFQEDRVAAHQSRATCPAGDRTSIVCDFQIYGAPVASVQSRTRSVSGPTRKVGLEP